MKGLLESNKTAKDIVQHLTEMPALKKKGDVVLAKGKELKKLGVGDVEENMIIFREPKGNAFMPEGMTVMYFMDTPESAQDMKNGNIDWILIPSGAPMGGFGRETPFERAFKDNDDKNGVEHIIAFLQGYTDEDTIFVDFLKVRDGYQRNSIASKMVRALKKEFPNAEMTTSKRTDQGDDFFQSEFPGTPEKQ